VALRGKRDIVLLGRQCEYIPPARLLQVLSRFDLFLAPSGVVMPLCHNVVEAMAAGCIPVLQYPHLMEPPLEHGINCLAYDNAEQLHTVLERFPDISATEVVAMRRHVLAYYKEHLAPEAVVEKLRTLAGKQARLRVNAEMLSTQLLLEQRTDQDRTVMAGQ
jgi:glycosyltransferase involved in cell wall biosynthesis